MQLVKSMLLQPNLSRIGSISEGLARDAAPSVSQRSLRFRINVALSEALANAVIHGCSEEPGEISIEYFLDNDCHVFTISDPGGGPDREKFNEPTLPVDVLDEHHRGIILIHWAADEVLHETTKNGFILTLRFNPRTSLKGSELPL